MKRNVLLTAAVAGMLAFAIGAANATPVGSSVSIVPSDLDGDAIIGYIGQPGSGPPYSIVSLYGTGADTTTGFFQFTLTDNLPVIASLGVSAGTVTTSGYVALSGTAPNGQIQTVNGNTAGTIYEIDVSSTANAAYTITLQEVGVPEIDAAAGTGAIGLLLGAMALVGERRRRKVA